MSTASLSAALEDLRSAVAPVRLPLELPGVQAQRQSARDMSAQLQDYVLPRLATIEAPLLCVVGGSTGAGKSTLVNSMIGRRVTIPGVIRPTTRSPVLIYNPADEKWFSDDRILPGMARVHGASLEIKALQLVAEPTLPPGLALLDAPDIDSVVQENRELASQLLQAADLWLFVTSAARYADAVPWDYLHQAAERSASVGVVLDRVPPAAMHDVPQHLATLMTQRGLENSPLFAVPETTADADGLLPDAAVAPIRNWLATLAADQQSRQRVVLQTLDGAIGQIEHRAPRLAAAVRDQTDVVAQLQHDADESFAEASRSIALQTADGSLLRGEVLARWQDFVGTGEFFRALEEKVGWLRDRLKAVFAGPPKGADNVKVAVEAGLEALVDEQVRQAVERAEAAWRAHPAGRQLLAQYPDDLRRPSDAFTRGVQRAIRDWQGDVMDLVADEGMQKRSVARFAALGVNGASVALMLFVFAHSAGLTGAEVGIAGGAAVLSQRVLEAVFGDDAVRKLAAKAKQDLDARVDALCAAELERFHAALRSLQVEPGQSDRILEAVRQVQSARAGGLDLEGGQERQALPSAPQAALPAAPAAPSAEARYDARPALATGMSGEPAALPGRQDAPEVLDAEIVEEGRR